MAEMVTLYEDNAGGLYLHRQGDASYYAEVETVRGASFVEDAAALAAGDTGDWSLPTRPVEEIIDNADMQPRADYRDGAVELIDGGEYAGAAARKYLGLPPA